MNIHPRRFALSLKLAGLLYAAALAEPYAGGWNDGSRLATVAALAERGTFCIDGSIYVDPSLAGEIKPYPADNSLLMRKGTLDKLLIDGRFYSDKTPVPAVLMAASYRAAVFLGWPEAESRPDLFAWLMTLLWSGGAFLAALLGLHSIGRRIGLPGSTHVVLLAAFALATVNIAYVRHVNNHILMLGAVMQVFALLLKDPTGRSRIDSLLIGLLAGFAYTIDLGIGPLFAAALFGYCLLFRNPGAPVGERIRSFLPVPLGALPFIVAHHVVNYRIAGTFGPANANPAFFDWPGCPFNEKTMTGSWKHAGVGKFFLYAADMMVGKKGFLFHNLPLLAGGFLAFRSGFSDSAERRIARFGLAWAAAAWLVYAASSNNLSGVCCSIRWFVPLLAPGFVVLALTLRNRPEVRGDFKILAGWGTVMGVGMAVGGPWAQHMVPLYWFIAGGALVNWGAYRIYKQRLMESQRRSLSENGGGILRQAA